MSSKGVAEALAIRHMKEFADLLEEAVKTGYKIGLEDGKVLGAQK